MRWQRDFAHIAALAVCAAFGSTANAELINLSPTHSVALAVSETVVGGDSQITIDFPGAETPSDALDGDNGTKFLAFDGEADDGSAENSGMIVFFDSPVTIEAIRFGIANDAPERDPGSFTLEGSNSVTPATYGESGGRAPAALIPDAADWTPIVGTPAATGINEPGDTFLDAFASRLTYTDELPFERLADSFSNDTAYSAYRILFSDLRFVDNGIMQVGEVELLAVPEPTSLVIVLAGLAACAAGRRG